MRVFLILSLIPCLLPAQDNEMRFAKHLYLKGFYSDALLQLGIMTSSGQYGSDTLAYCASLCLEQTGRKDSAASLLREFSPESPLFITSRFRLALLLAGGRDYSGAVKALDSVSIPDNCKNELRFFFLSAFDLLGGKPRPDQGMNCVNEWQQKLDRYRHTLSRNRRKTAFMGGFLSALVPGLGRIYAGKPRLALPSFIPIATLGLQAWEGFRHKRFQSGRFWIFGSLATLFYVGNIYGSALSVRITKQERYDMVEHQLMLDLRLAFRDLWGKPW